MYRQQAEKPLQGNWFLPKREGSFLPLEAVGVDKTHQSAPGEGGRDPLYSLPVFRFSGWQI